MDWYYWWSAWPIVLIDIISIHPSIHSQLYIHIYSIYTYTYTNLSIYIYVQSTFMCTCMYMYMYMYYVYMEYVYVYTYMYLLFLLRFDRWIDGHRFHKDFMIDHRYYRSKRKNLLPMDRYYRWSGWTIVSMDNIRNDPSIHRWLWPAKNTLFSLTRSISK
jgi:hypothetical protein